MQFRRANPRLPAGFSRLLISWFAAQSADGMRFAGLPLLAFATDGSPAAVAAVATATSLPWLLIALPAGLLVDRLDPIKVMVGANLVRALGAAIVVVAIETGAVSIAVLAVIGFCLTAAETFTDSAAQSLLVQMVPTGQLERANARFISSENVGFDLIGPLAAGALFTVNHWLPFAICAVAFGVAAGVMLTIPGEPSEPLRTRPGPAAGAVPDAGSHTNHHREPIRRSMSGAFRAVFGDPVLRSLVVTVALLAGTVAAMEGVLVVYATGPLHFTSALFPTLLASYSIGLLAAAPFVQRTVRRVSAGALMLTALVLVGVTLVVLGAFPHPVVAWISFAVMGAALGFWNILSASRRQRRTPRRIAARVSSAFRTIAWGAVPLGAALGGIGASHWGVGRVFFVAGLVVLVLAVVMAGPFLRPIPADIPADIAAGVPADIPPAPEVGDRIQGRDGGLERRTCDAVPAPAPRKPMLTGMPEGGMGEGELLDIDRPGVETGRKGIQP